MEILGDNSAWTAASPTLSVLIPTYADDPLPLLHALEAQAGDAGGRVAALVIDDGGPTPELADHALTVVQSFRLPVRVLRLAQNEGRSRARNQLVRASRSPYLLFLDSDMLPDRSDFLARYLDLIDAKQPPVIFGGISLLQTPRLPETELHRHLALQKDCATVATRSRDPAKHVFTSNLLARREVFEGEPFSERFRGWGWEDVEWAVRVSRRWPILHVDNTATHLGLNPDAVLVRKFEESPTNFGMLVKEYGPVIRSYPIFRAARWMRRVPGLTWLRPRLRGWALTPSLPVGLRAAALKLYRAAIYVDHLP